MKHEISILNNQLLTNQNSLSQMNEKNNMIEKDLNNVVYPFDLLVVLDSLSSFIEFVKFTR